MKLAAAALLALCACSDDVRVGSPDASAAEAGDEGGGCTGFTCFDARDERPPAVRVRDEVRSVCGMPDGCHGGSTGTGFVVSPGHEFDTLIDAASTENPPMLRVKPGDPEHSYAWLKIHCDAATCDDIDGGRMPSGSPYDPALDVLFRAWIEAGAPMQ